jgi:plasmid stabilization system protein ParE
MSSYRLSKRAAADIHAIWDYLAIECGSPQSAYQQVESLYARFSLLATSPLLGEARNDLKQGLQQNSWVKSELVSDGGVRFPRHGQGK